MNDDLSVKQISKLKNCHNLEQVPDGLRDRKLKEKKFTFFEILVLFSTYLSEFPHKKSKYLAE